MHIYPTEQETLDIDYFTTDDAVHTLHVASGSVGSYVVGGGE
ncbi:hypothetical protein [Hymenobacter sp. APR13]|nr:hypothetical protein [Hymenobacter sp. APR13]AII52896.1 hypothetical protein N008_13030 [Hymenobacter sp. APR13]